MVCRWLWAFFWDSCFRRSGRDFRTDGASWAYLPSTAATVRRQRQQPPLTSWAFRENMSVGMVLSTLGLVVAMAVGMIMVNYGIRKGWGTYVKEPQKQPDYFYGGVLPKEKRAASGHTVTTSISINHLALQVSWLLLALFIGRQLFGSWVPSLSFSQECQACFMVSSEARFCGIS